MSQDKLLQEQQLQERQEKLQGFFSKSQEWKEVKELLLDVIYSNADAKLKSVNCDKRDIYVGKCLAIQEIHDAVRDIKEMEVKKEE